MKNKLLIIATIAISYGIHASKDDSKVAFMQLKTEIEKAPRHLIRQTNKQLNLCSYYDSDTGHDDVSDIDDDDDNDYISRQPVAILVRNPNEKCIQKTSYNVDGGGYQVRLLEYMPSRTIYDELLHRINPTDYDLHEQLEKTPFRIKTLPMYEVTVCTLDGSQSFYTKPDQETINNTAQAIIVAHNERYSLQYAFYKKMIKKS